MLSWPGRAGIIANSISESLFRERCIMNESDLTTEFLRKIVAWMRLNGHRNLGDLSRGELLVLQLLVDKGEIRPAELGRLMEISSARVAALLNGMERKGWLARRPDPRDRRKIRVVITEAGEAMALRKRREIHAYTARVLAKLGEADTREFLRILDRLIALSEQELKHLSPRMEH